MRWWFVEPCRQSIVVHGNPLLPLTLIISCGIFFRLNNLGAAPIWYDEAASWYFAQQSLDFLWGDAARLEANPPFYYTILKAFLWLGQSEAVLRLPSVLLGALAIPLIYLLGRIVGGHPAGLCAALILTTSPIHIAYSQEARTYALLVTAALGTVAALAWLIQDPGRACQPLLTLSTDRRRSPEHAGRRPAWAAWLGYSAGLSAALYAHNTAALLLAMTNLFALIWWIRVARWAPAFAANWVAANAIPLSLWAWWMLIAIDQAAAMQPDTWWLGPPTVQGTIDVLRAVYGQSAAYSLQPATDLFCLLPALLGLWSLRMRRHYLLLLTFMTIGMAAVTVLISFWKPIFMIRTMLWPITGYHTLQAAGIVSIRPALPRYSLLAGLIALQWLSIGNLEQGSNPFRPHEPWDAVARHVAERVQPGDLLVFSPSAAELPFGYYYGVLPDSRYTIGRTPWHSLPAAVVSIAAADLPSLARSGRLWLISRSGRLNVLPELPETGPLRMIEHWSWGSIAVRLLAD